MNLTKNPTLLYDGECPFCSQISQYYKIKNAIPGLQIVSLRDAEALKKLELPKDLNFNDGMILILERGTILQGEEAFRYINQNAKIEGLKDLFVLGINSKPWITKLVYPLAFQLRKLALIIKKKPIKLERIDLKNKT